MKLKEQFEIDLLKAMTYIEINNLLNKLNRQITELQNKVETDDYWETRCKLMEHIEEQNPCDPDITDCQIEAWSKYHSFIKNRGQRD